MSDGWERVDKQRTGAAPYPEPTVVVSGEGQNLYINIKAYRAMDTPEYVSFYKTGSKVGIEPCKQRSGINPHKVQENRVTSFGWHECDTEGHVELTYDEDCEFWVFDTEKLQE